MRLVYVQYGDYGEALRRLDQGGPETYQAQRHTVRWVQQAAARHPTTVVCLNSPRPSDETVSGIRCIGRSLYDRDTPRQIAQLVESLEPEAVICRTPLKEVMDWSRRRRVPCLPLLADSLTKPGLRHALRRRRLARVLGQQHFACIANHSLSASRWLTTLGIAPERIVPWEFPATLRPGPVKQAHSGRGLRILYVGAVIAEKGVGDLVEAVGLLDGAAAGTSLTIAGEGKDKAALEARARQLGIAASFVGSVPYDHVARLMLEHDAIVVPSRHSYPEGLPNTIYEGLASGTPVLVSDHPVIVERIRHGHSALVFRGSDPRSLADTLERLRTDPGLYHRLSANGAEAYRSLYVGIEWSELLARFVDDPLNRTGWVEPISLASIESRLKRTQRTVRLVVSEELADAPQSAPSR